jgi:GNAT superfamily N-acetyltransferase
VTVPYNGWNRAFPDFSSLALLQMNHVVFRSATANDCKSIASLHTESWRNAYRGILPDAYLDGAIVEDRVRLWQGRFLSPHGDRRYIVLAEAERTLVGFACVLLDEEPQWGACLDNLHVLPRCKRRGLGKQLFHKAAQWVKSKESEWPIHLWVFEDNIAARRFYDALGGELVERRTRKVLEGIERPSLRYVWHDLQKLLSNITTGST